MTPTTRASRTPARRDGSTQVAHVVFGGTLVGAGLLAGALWALSGPPYALWATAAAAVGTVVAALLWSRGWQGPACRAHTTALLLSGALLYFASGTLGGAATVVFLAAMLTASGLRQLSGASFALAGFVGILLLAFASGAEVQEVLGLSVPMRNDRSEILLVVLDLVSLVALGLYLVVLDRSLRQAWAHAEKRNQDLLSQTAALHADLAHLRAEEPALHMALRRQHRLTTLAVALSDRGNTPEPLAKVADLLREEVPQLGAPRRLVRLMRQQELEPMIADLTPGDQAFMRAVAELVVGLTPRATAAP